MTILPAETINDPKSLDAIFVEMHKAKKVPMTDDQARFSIPIMMAEDEAINRMHDDFSKHFPFGGFFKRCEIFPIKYDNRLQVWLGVMTNKYGIGAMILNAYYVQWWAATNSEESIITKNEISINDTLHLSTVCERCFPFGVFNKETLHEFWDKQKVRAKPDNLIDHPASCTSFMQIKRTEPINSSDMVF